MVLQPKGCGRVGHRRTQLHTARPRSRPQVSRGRAIFRTPQAVAECRTRAPERRTHTPGMQNSTFGTSSTFPGARSAFRGPSSTLWQEAGLGGAAEEVGVHDPAVAG